MRNLLNSDQSYTGLVQKYIGSAYDVVYAVYLALEGIMKVEGIIGTPEWDELVKLAPDFQKFMQDLAKFHNTFYGALDKEPLTRPDGMPSQDGDLYYDKVHMGLYMYEDGAWYRVGATSNQLEVIKVESKHVQGSVVRIPLTHGYHPGTNSIMVFVNATFQYPVSKANPDGAYVEVDSHTIEFHLLPNQAQGNLEVGDVVTVMTGGVVTNVEHEFAVETEVQQVSLPQQTVFPVQMGYLPASHNMEIYVDGIRQVIGMDYLETDSDTVTFTHPLPHGTVVVFKKGHVVGNTAGTGTAEKFGILNVVGEFYLRRKWLDQNSAVLLLGHSAVADGGSGIFVYAPQMSRTLANGGTVIDASVPLDQQGTGVGSGVWVRQYGRELDFKWFGVQENLVRSLTEIPLARNNDLVYVGGYWEEGDGGEGWFYWDADRSKMHHDGGVIIDPHQTFPHNAQPQAVSKWFTPTGGTRGCWIRMDQDKASLAWFGAKGDGQQDNSLIFEGVFRALTHNVINELYIPAGDYLHNGTFAIRTSQVKGLKLYGEGKDSRIIFGTICSDQPFSFDHCKDIRICDLSFEDRRPSNPGYGIQFREGDNLAVENCGFSGFENTAIAFRGDQSKPKSMDRMYVTNCVFTHSSCAEGPLVQCTPGQKSTELQLRFNTFRGCGSTAGHPLVISGVACHDAVVSNNFFDGCTGTAVQVLAYEEVQVSENHFTQQTGDCVQVTVDDHPSYGNANLYHCLVRDNVVEGCTGWLVTVDGDRNNNGPVAVEGNHVVNGGLFHSPPKSQRKPLVFLRDNLCSWTHPGRADALAQLQDLAAPLVRGNLFNGGGEKDLQLDDCPNARIQGNEFLGSNAADAAGQACINLIDNAAGTYVILGNVVQKAGGHPKRLYGATGNPVVLASNNDVRELEGPISDYTAAPARAVDATFAQFGVNRIMLGSSPPGNGDFKQGDIVFNSAAASGSPAGWTCTAAGNPGTWTAMGVLA